MLDIIVTIYCTIAVVVGLLIEYLLRTVFADDIMFSKAWGRVAAPIFIGIVWPVALVWLLHKEEVEVTVTEED